MPMAPRRVFQRGSKLSRCRNYRVVQSLSGGSIEGRSVNVPPGLSNIVAIAAGGRHDLALIADGTGVGWGVNNFGESTVPSDLTNLVALAAGESHSLALKADGTVVAWGFNYLGQCVVPNGVSNVVT